MARTRRNKSKVSRNGQYNVMTSARAKQATRAETLHTVPKEFFALQIERREDTAAAIEATARSSEGRSLLWRQNCCAQLVQGLTDSSEKVLRSFSSALREMVMDEASGDECCNKLIKLNILPVLDEALQKIRARLCDIPLDSSEVVTGASTSLDIAGNLIYIATRISEVSPFVERAGTSKNFIALCVKLLSVQRCCPISTITLLYQCLDSHFEHTSGSVPTDDIRALLEQLCNVAQYHDKCLVGLAVCVLQRVCFIAIKQSVIRAEQFESIIRLILDSISTTIIELNTLYTGRWTDIQPMHKDLFEVTVPVVLDTMARLALPISTQDGFAHVPVADKTRITTYVLQILIERLVVPVLPLALPNSSSNAEAPDLSEPALMRMMSLEFLHNLAWTIAITDSTKLRDAWTVHAGNLWTWTLTHLSSFLISSEEEADSSISLLYALAKFSGASLPISTSEINSFIKLYHSSLNADMQTKIVGLLGCLAVRASDINNNKSVGMFLMTVISALPRSDSEVVVEALNAIFDIYADREYDYDKQVFVRGNFLTHLIKVVPKVDAMRKAIDKRRYRELKDQADEAFDNLVAFIDYKGKEQA
ncbi:protein of unknown function [Taphrina deformans PYCC 5710]|uniref:SYO1-like TPR repeats domain-containing protein n=1 Tax=Taphrina deformans (strain PYCC 5710 / ATCC 11124 / CBS 356.35 / IMI 108563 / JCM 9778 / NBRC 8474) TaxID=1097556 RepID=R4XF84_TAPDE|nr:protein of unknown function [Taphrina deformans PYCC 5710]|eukprot:CCG84441.1 protein of unknown function [Taphrina deformans PYCC 5710]